MRCQGLQALRDVSAMGCGLGPYALHLAQRLKDSHSSVVCEAARTLTLVPPEDVAAHAAEQLCDLIAAQCATTREAAMQAFVILPPLELESRMQLLVSCLVQAIQIVLADPDDDGEEVKLAIRTALAALGGLKHLEVLPDAAVASLLSCLRDPNTGGDDYQSWLALTDRKHEGGHTLLCSVVQTLGSKLDIAALSTHATLFAELLTARFDCIEFARHPPNAVRVAALAVLQTLPPQTMVDALVRILPDMVNESNMSKESQLSLLSAVLEALSFVAEQNESPVATAVAPVLAVAEEDVEDWLGGRQAIEMVNVQHVAMTIFHRLSSPVLAEHKPLLLRLADINSEDSDSQDDGERGLLGAAYNEVRCKARALLHNLEPTKGHAAFLVNVLNDETLREEALNALVLVNNLAEYVEPILPCLQAADSCVAAAAQAALEKLPPRVLARFAHNAKVVTLLGKVLQSGIEADVKQLASPEVSELLVNAQSMPLADSAQIEELMKAIFEPGGMVSRDASSDFYQCASTIAHAGDAGQAAGMDLARGADLAKSAPQQWPQKRPMESQGSSSAEYDNSAKKMKQSPGESHM